MKHLLLTLLLCITATANAAEYQLKWPSANPVNTCIFNTISSAKEMVGDFTGGNCPAVNGTPTPAPVITNDLNELPATALAGSSTLVAWAASADQCTYSNSTFPTPVPAWPTVPYQSCNSTQTCASLHMVNVTFPSVAGSYTFDVTCKYNASTVLANARKTVQVTSPNPVGCIAPSGLRRHVYGKVANNDTSSRETDLTKYENVFGYNIVNNELKLFPGTANLNQRLYIPSGYYVALQFTVPATMPLATYGQYRFEETQPQTSPARMSYTISRQCGDFSTTNNPTCVMNNGPPNSSLFWGYDPSNTRLCQLTPGQTYYLNIVHAPLSNITSSYCGGHCGNTIQNQKLSLGGW